MNKIFSFFLVIFLIGRLNWLNFCISSLFMESSNSKLLGHSGELNILHLLAIHLNPRGQILKKLKDKLKYNLGMFLYRKLYVLLKFIISF